MEELSGGVKSVVLDGGLGEVRIANDPPALARSAAAELVRRAEQAVAERGRFTIALGGGSTPRDLYRLLADANGPFRARFPWRRTQYFWGDERHVPPDHPDSNYRMAREAMLDSADVPAENVHRIAAENPDAGAAAEAYEAVLREQLASDGTLPRFDLILLGLGPEGHTASLFPGSPALHDDARLVAAPWVPAMSTFRITLTPPVINRAACVAFLISGEKKREILTNVLFGARDPDLYPAQIVEPKAGELLWLVDADAVPVELQRRVAGKS